MPLHKTCIISRSPIEENKEVVEVFIATEITSFNNEIINIPFSSNDYSDAWDNFKIFGFPIMATFKNHSQMEYKDTESESLLLSIINQELENKYETLNELNKAITTKEYKVNKKSKNKQISSFLILKDVFDLIISEKRSRSVSENMFIIPDTHSEDYIHYNESLLENKKILSEIKDQNIKLLKDFYVDEEDNFDEKNIIFLLKHHLKSHYRKGIASTGKSLFNIALENPEKGNELGKHLTNLYWVAFSLNDLRIMITPTLHSYENREYFELASFYRKLANVIEQQSINSETVRFTPIEKINEYTIKENELLENLNDFDDEYKNEVINCYKKYKFEDKYLLNPNVLTSDEKNLFFNEELLNYELKDKMVYII